MGSVISTIKDLFLTKPTPVSSVVYTSSTCGICLNNFTPTDVRHLLPCGHDYHRDCLNTWLSVQQSCPLCRSTLITRIGRQLKKNVVYVATFVVASITTSSWFISLFTKTLSYFIGGGLGYFLYASGFLILMYYKLIEQID